MYNVGHLITFYLICHRYVWVLEGDTGKVLEGWPVKLPSEVRATVLVTKLVPGESNAVDIVSSFSRPGKVINQAAVPVSVDNQQRHHTSSPSKVRV